MFWLCYDSKHVQKLWSLPKMKVHFFKFLRSILYFFEILFLLNNYPIITRLSHQKWKNQNFVPILVFLHTADIWLANLDLVYQLQILIQVCWLCFLLPKVAYTEKKKSPSLKSELNYSSSVFNISSNLTLGPYLIFYASFQFYIFQMGSTS